MVAAATKTSASRRHLQTEIWIDASQAIVWDILVDTALYPTRNPFIRRLEGALVSGHKIKATIQPLGKRAMVFRPTVLQVSPGKELRWLGRLLFPGLFDGEHVFRLVPQKRGTLVVQEEWFTGVLVRLIDIQTFQPSFEALNKALKARAEAIAR